MLSLKFATVPVADQARALAWYTDKLGCSVIEDVPFGSQRWIELAFPAGGSHIVLFTAPWGREPGRHICGVVFHGG